METKKIYFKDFIPTAWDQGNYSTDDTIALLLPLVRKLLDIHESGQVIPLGEPDVIFVSGRSLDIDAVSARPPMLAPEKLQHLFRDLSAGSVSVVTPDLMHLDPLQPLRYPAYLRGYGSYEQLLGHHDPLTDIFSLGLILGSIALDLDLHDLNDLETWIHVRSNPSRHNPRIHPTLARLITGMTHLDRTRRIQDLYDVLRRLEHYREYESFSPDDDIDDQDPLSRESFILQKLRNRLFDTSRRNRLLYYKPNTRFVNLTIGSVPIVLHYQSIRPEHLFTWNDQVGENLKGMKEIVLNKYLRFEDHDWLPGSLDKVRVESRRALQEYGLSPLKLVIAFLNWHNLKEDTAERIQSPLLLLPAELKKNKRLKEDHYILKVLDNNAEVNPVLAGQLKDLYNIHLPESIDLDETSPLEFYQTVKDQIENANQGIALDLIDKPRIQLFQREARQTVFNYNKRLGRQPAATDPTDQTDQTDQTTDPTLTTDDSQKTLRAAGIPDPGYPKEEEKLLFALAKSENNPYSWDFDTCNMVLGNFNYKKMSLVRDYNLVIDQQRQHPVFDELFSTNPRVLKNHPFDLNRPDDWFHVIKADPTQTRAILQSRAGYSYIIQGPPGTGKSQTITNLIADFVARGKTILFVCEKRAALDVVYHRLKQNGLDELCCYIHDSQSDKKEFIKDLKSTYEDFTGTRMDLHAMHAARTSLLEKMKRAIAILDEFHTTGKTVEKETGIETRLLIDQIIALRPHLPTLDAKEEELLPSWPEWQKSRALITELTQALEEEDGEGRIFAEHPFSRIRESVFHTDSPLNFLDTQIDQALTLMDKIEEIIKKYRIDDTLSHKLGALKTLVQYATLLHPLSITGNLTLADPDSDLSRSFVYQTTEYRNKKKDHQDLGQKNVHWKQRIDPMEMQSCIDLATRYEGRFFSFLNAPWRKLQKHLQQSYDFSAHVVRPTYGHILANLASEYESERQLTQTRSSLQTTYHIESLDTTFLTLELLRDKREEPALRYLLHHPNAQPLIAALHTNRQNIQDLESKLTNILQEPGESTITQNRQTLEDIRAKAALLPGMLTLLRSFTQQHEATKITLRKFSLTPLSIEAAIARKALNFIYQAHRSFQAIDGQALGKAAMQLGDAYTDMLTKNAELIRGRVRQHFLDQLDLASLAASQLDEEKKKFKRTFNDGRKILENEFGKSIRYKSVRELLARESGIVLKGLKPIWLMSPYSVSDSIPLDNDLFDVVIFDEASQITLEEGIPALYRSRQAIIVGDEKQMPPTDFFNAGSNDLDPDDLDGTDEDGDDWRNDAPSLLAQGARKLDSTLLSWHYRSHYETLISFSNHAFYAGNLLTIPDKTIHHGEKPPIVVKSSEDAPRHTDTIFDRSIGFHFLPDSVYDKRNNIAEAAYIAEMVRELLNREVKESIGIVAFSQQQQQTIENALDALAAKDANFNLKLEEAYNRTEQDQFVGLIVKNLENIQGDERDIIIMSVCYGPDPRRRISMNFGPINKRGGEKRLNVLFSRARKHIAVVSSMHYQDITNEYNEGANYLRRFLQYAEMVSTGNMNMARAVLDSLTARQEKPASTGEGEEEVLLQQLKIQLENIGYEVALRVGQSDFKCSLAVKAKKGDASYSLGILIDDGKHYRNDNLVEQYYLRPAIMEAFGWKILPVYARDWLHQPQKVLDMIKRIMPPA